MAVHEVVFPMPGKVVSIDVEVGGAVSQNDTLAVFEAMKIEMPLAATAGGTVVEINAGVGDMIEADAVFCVIED
jgi:biotin carboxyl carrier protein